MKKISLKEIFGNDIVFRNLNSLNSNLPKFASFGEELLKTKELPRKKSLSYSKVISFFLKKKGRFKKIVLVGDSIIGEGKVAYNLSQLGYKVKAFIYRAKEEEEKNPFSPGLIWEGQSWKELVSFNNELMKLWGGMDDKTTLLVDLDKTLIAAKGRNNQAVNRARLDAIFKVIEEFSSVQISREKIITVYQELKRPLYFPLTCDDQGVIVFITTLIYFEVISLDEFKLYFRQGKSLEKLMLHLEEKIAQTGNLVLQKKANIFRKELLQSDPTLFKCFRRKELDTTIARMDFLPEKNPALLKEEILINREVFDFCRYGKERGSFLFCITDKPDEASYDENSFPVKTIHDKKMKIWGEKIFNTLMSGD